MQIGRVRLPTLGAGEVDPVVIDARRNLSRVGRRWYPVVKDTHRFFMLCRVLWSITMILLALPLSFLFGLLAPFPKDVGWFMLCVTIPCSLVLPLLALLVGSASLPTAVTEDVSAWPYSVGILVKWVAFLGTLHWLAAGADLGEGGVSCVEMLILYELWARESSPSMS